MTAHPRGARAFRCTEAVGKLWKKDASCRRSNAPLFRLGSGLRSSTSAALGWVLGVTPADKLSHQPAAALPPPLGNSPQCPENNYAGVRCLHDTIRSRMKSGVKLVLLRQLLLVLSPKFSAIARGRRPRATKRSVGQEREFCATVFYVRGERQGSLLTYR